MRTIQWCVTIESRFPGDEPYIDVRPEEDEKAGGGIEDEFERVWGQPISGVRDVWMMEIHMPLDCAAVVATLGRPSTHAESYMDGSDNQPHRISMMEGDVFVLKTWGMDPTIKHKHAHRVEKRNKSRAIQRKHHT